MLILIGAFADALLDDEDLDPDSFVNEEENGAEPASEDGDAEDGTGDDVLIGGEGIDTIKTGEGDDIASTGDFDLDGDGDTDLDILNSELDKVTFEDEEHI